jgi:tetratricopeptide (TPR) repeat protein
MLVLLGALGAALRGGLTSYRAAASARDEEVPRPLVLRFKEPEKARYAYRVRQLEQDLQSDPSDFEVLLRLGQLHLRLAEGEVERRGQHLRKARHYLLRANEQTQFRWEQNWIRGLMEAANSPNPMLDVASIPGDYGPSRREDEGWIRMRLGFLEEQVGFHPRDARLLRRLASSYAALYAVMSPRGQAQMIHPEWGVAGISDPREVRLLAEQYFRRALQCSRTREARCRTLYGESRFYRITHQPERSAALLDRFLALQPNNWLVSMEAAVLSRELSQTGKAERYQALSARWRLPGWI